MAQLSYTPAELKRITGEKLTEASKAHAEEMAKAKAQAEEDAKAAKAERDKLVSELEAANKRASEVEAATRAKVEDEINALQTTLEEYDTMTELANKKPVDFGPYIDRVTTTTNSKVAAKFAIHACKGARFGSTIGFLKGKIRTAPLSVELKAQLMNQVVWLVSEMKKLDDEKAAATAERKRKQEVRGKEKSTPAKKRAKPNPKDDEEEEDNSDNEEDPPLSDRKKANANAK